MSALPRGAIVRHRMREVLGEVVRGPRRASRGMVWVVWEGASRPILQHRAMLHYVARRGTVASVKATLAAMLTAGALALAVTGTATAQVQTHPGGGVTCPGGYTAQRLNGQLVIVCPGPPMTPEQARQQREQAAQIARDEAERLRRQSVEEGACGADVPAFRRSPNCP